jgi:DNA-binding protein HU-beta
MTKKEFIDSVAELNDMSKKDVELCVGAIFETIQAVMEEGDSISFQGFGTFSTSERAARTGRNPQTGKSLKIPAMTVPKFKASSALKVALK